VAPAFLKSSSLSSSLSSSVLTGFEDEDDHEDELAGSAFGQMTSMWRNFYLTFTARDLTCWP
jgi:hypothetical protein